jgi:NAD(P)-dependent dehydrogenase (short-subunit alcohol dehydrogenase family)
MESISGKLAIVTGGGSGMGRELVLRLTAHGCSVAACDLNADTLRETRALAEAGAAPGARVSDHVCDVSDEAAVLRFRDAALAAHGAPSVDLVFANAAIWAAESFITDDRDLWERVFATNWWGVYHTARAFLPLLIASPEGVLVNTSSVNGFYATLGPGWPNSAYSTAKFAVKGFTESLIEDLRVSAPHVRVALVMPNHVATNIIANSVRALGGDAGSAETVKANSEFRDGATVTAAQAAAAILDGVRAGAWRIVIGADGRSLDEFVRASPELAYDYAELARYRESQVTDGRRARVPYDVTRE